jgi:hypothetical protein
MLGSILQALLVGNVVVTATDLGATCGRGSFETDLGGWQCMGLDFAPAASSEDLCIKACCDLGADACEVWQFCDEDCGVDDEQGGCWIGKKQNCRKYKGWTGGGNIPSFACPSSSGWNFDNNAQATLKVSNRSECCDVCNIAACQAWTWDSLTQECTLKEWVSGFYRFFNRLLLTFYSYSHPFQTRSPERLCPPATGCENDLLWLGTKHRLHQYSLPLLRQSPGMCCIPNW